MVTAGSQVDLRNLASAQALRGYKLEYYMQPNSTLLKLVCLCFMESFCFICEVGSHYINQTSLNFVAKVGTELVAIFLLQSLEY